ncbi:hypothetical protein [Haloarchaeobius sp. TZWWS8]|uniref:hypothetical protein n=1 Tax=Haloarchaeobius sp. TZWWS8 TaxID=3446121 RepID=UPI003EB84F1C
MLTVGIFLAGLVLFVGGVATIRTTHERHEPADQLFATDEIHRDAPMQYVQTDGAVLGVVGLVVMIVSTLL